MPRHSRVQRETYKQYYNIKKQFFFHMWEITGTLNCIIHLPVFELKANLGIVWEFQYFFPPSKLWDSVGVPFFFFKWEALVLRSLLC